MTEIRVCWLPEIEHTFGSPEGCGPWMPWSADNFDTLIAIQQAGVEVYGAGTHWVEDRHSVGPASPVPTHH